MDDDDDIVLVLRQRFGARLRALRLENKLEGRDVAALAGCTIGHYYKLERGAVECSDRLLVRLRKGFRLDEVDFYTFPDANPVRHGIYDLLRRAPEELLLKTKLFILEGLRSQTPEADVTASASDHANSGRRRTRSAR